MNFIAGLDYQIYWVADELIATSEQLLRAISEAARGKGEVVLRSSPLELEQTPDDQLTGFPDCQEPPQQETTMVIERDIDLAVFRLIFAKSQSQVLAARQASLVGTTPTESGVDRNPWEAHQAELNQISCLAIRLRGILRKYIEEQIGQSLDSAGFFGHVFRQHLSAINFRAVATVVYQGFTPESIVTEKNLLIRRTDSANYERHPSNQPQAKEEK